MGEAGLMQRKPMKRTGFKPKQGDGQPVRFSSFTPKPLKDKQSAKSRSAFKRKPRKHIEGYTDQRYLDACIGQPCYLKIPNTCGGWAAKETVVYCHSNQGRHGKGYGIKAKDYFTVPGCMWCHQFIDQNTTGASKALKFRYWDDAFSEWLPVRVGLIGD